MAFQFRGRHRPHHDGGTREPLADIVIGIAQHFEFQPRNPKRAERLPSRAAQTHRHMVRLQFHAPEFGHDLR